jgi:hypothetical protein
MKSLLSVCTLMDYNFFIQGFILIFKIEVLMYMTQNAANISFNVLLMLHIYSWKAASPSMEIGSMPDLFEQEMCSPC